MDAPDIEIKLMAVMSVRGSASRSVLACGSYDTSCQDAYTVQVHDDLRQAKIRLETCQRKLDDAIDGLDNAHERLKIAQMEIDMAFHQHNQAWCAANCDTETFCDECREDIV
jgi:hypothetical protein